MFNVYIFLNVGFYENLVKHFYSYCIFVFVYLPTICVIARGLKMQYLFCITIISFQIIVMTVKQTLKANTGSFN